jgi:hypothetical protein
MSRPPPESLPDVSSLRELRNEIFNPLPLGLVTSDLTSARPPMTEYFCTGIMHQESAYKSMRFGLCKTQRDRVETRIMRIPSPRLVQ